VAKFTYVVDREFKLVEPVTFFPDLELQGQAVTLNPGDSVVYRGVIEIGGKGRYTFDHQGQKLFSPDRAALDRGLDENYDELVKP
jgi:hypothetical protein